MKIFRSSAEMTAWSNQQAPTHSIGLVPTMGSLHQGHLSLIRMAKAKADRVVTSIFVNPLQFGPNEDFDRYPRIFEQDAAKAQEEGVDAIFAPTVEDLYPEGFQTAVIVRNLPKVLCGKARPGHFNGVTTVVAKLFHIVKANLAVFGAKDFQQLAVIRRMVVDLSMDITILSHPIVREADGLAMSSRNIFLSKTERQSALRLNQVLGLCRSWVAEGTISCAELLAKTKEYLIEDKSIKMDYIEIINQLTLQPQEEADSTSVLAMAVKIGKTRLIDNGYLFDGEHE